MKRTYNKLVRDKIPEIIESKGEKACIKILTDDEYITALYEKAKEELFEVETAKSLEETKNELCDLLEVVRAMAQYNGFSLEDVIREANIKATERGGFSNKVFLIGVE